MGSGFYAKKLNGECYVGSGICRPFDQISCHVMIGTKQIAGPMSKQASYCGNVLIPQCFTHGVKAYPYNTTYENGSGLAVPNFFTASQTAAWATRTVTVSGYPITYEGPPYSSNHAVVGMKSKSVSSMFANRTGVNFLDAAVSYQTNLYGSPCGTDWLGFLHPGGYMYTPAEVPEPLQAESFFEDGGYSVDFSTNYPFHYNIMKFCSPLDVYSTLAGTELLGQYVGLCFVPIFGECAIKNPVGYLPDDPSVPYPPGALVTTTNQFVSLELWVYLAAIPASGKTLKSPRVARIRGWLPKAELTSGVNNTWCDHYQYLTFRISQGTPNDFAPSLIFNNTNGTTVTRRLIMSDLRVLIAA